MEPDNRQLILDEDKLVAELSQLGVTYLSNRPVKPIEVRPSPVQLLSDLVRQPSSRVRTAIIALFLLHPCYYEFVPNALELLNDRQRELLKLFYTASVFLQRLFQSDLAPFVRSDWVWLPNLFGDGLGIPSDLSPGSAISQLGFRHQELTLSFTNWSGTYKNVVHHLIRYKQREAQWNQQRNLL